MKYQLIKLLKNRQIKINQKLQHLRLVLNRDYIHRIWDGYRFSKRKCFKVIGKKYL